MNAKTNANANADALTAVGKLLDQSVQNGEKAVSLSAELTVALHATIQTGQIDALEVYEWLQSTDRGKKAEFLTTLCELYSEKYRAAVESLDAAAKDENKMRKKAVQTACKRQIASARVALSRGLTAAYWLHKANPDKVTVLQDGSLRLRMPDDGDQQLDGVFSMASVIRNAEDKFKAKITRAPATGGKNNTNGATDPAKSLEVAVKFVTDAVAGKTAKDISGATRDHMQTLLVTLLGVFGADEAGEMDMERIVSIYEADAA
jgi:hypothetical protein